MSATLRYQCQVEMLSKDNRSNLVCLSVETLSFYDEIIHPRQYSHCHYRPEEDLDKYNKVRLHSMQEGKKAELEGIIKGEGGDDTSQL